MSRAEELRALCNAAAILHPASPALNAARTISTELVDRLARADSTLQNLDSYDGIGDHDMEITPLQKVEERSLWILGQIQRLLHDDGEDPVESASTAPRKSVIIRLGYLVIYTQLIPSMNIFSYVEHV